MAKATPAAPPQRRQVARTRCPDRRRANSGSPSREHKRVVARFSWPRIKSTYSGAKSSGARRWRTHCLRSHRVTFLNQRDARGDGGGGRGGGASWSFASRFAFRFASARCAAARSFSVSSCQLAMRCSEPSAATEIGPSSVSGTCWAKLDEKNRRKDISPLDFDCMNAYADCEKAEHLNYHSLHRSVSQDSSR